MDGEASIGESLKYAREDHKHPSDTVKADKATSVNAGTGLVGGGDLSEDRTISHQGKPEAGLDAGGTGSFVTGVIVDTLGHVVNTTKGEAPTLSGGQEAVEGKYVSGVTVDGHAVNVTLEDIPFIPDGAEKLPKAPAETAVVGESTKYAREDHVHPVQTTISGNASTASKLETPRNIELSGDVTGMGSFDGSTDLNINTTVADDSHVHSNDTITSLDASKITTGIIDIDRIPKGAIERLMVVTDSAARFALTTDDVQNGDTVKQNDTGVMYFVVDDTKLDSEEGYSVYTAGAATSVPWSGVQDKPSNFPPTLGTGPATAYPGDKGEEHNKVIASLGTGLLTGSGSASTESDSVKLSFGKIGRGVSDGSTIFSTEEDLSIDIPAATTSTGGIMSAADKTMLETVNSWGNHADAGYVHESELENYMPNTGGTLEGPLVGTQIQMTSGSEPIYNDTEKIKPIDECSTPIVFSAGASTPK